jgi:hypothetical protein
MGKEKGTLIGVDSPASASFLSAWPGVSGRRRKDG